MNLRMLANSKLIRFSIIGLAFGGLLVNFILNYPRLSAEGKERLMGFKKSLLCGEIKYGNGNVEFNGISEDFFWVSFYNCGYFNRDSLNNYIPIFAKVAWDILETANNRDSFKNVQVKYLYDSEGNYYERFYYKVNNISM